MKELPNSMEAEQALIGSVLLDRTRLDYIDVKSEDFYQGKHKVLWTAILNHNADNQSWDMITLREYLQSIDSLQSVGNDNYLLQLQDSTIIPSHSQHYANVVKEKSELRKEIKILEEATRIAYEGESIADMVLGKLMKENAIESKSIDSILKHWDSAREGVRNTIPTPYADMDRRTEVFVKEWLPYLRVGVKVVSQCF